MTPIHNKTIGLVSFVWLGLMVAGAQAQTTQPAPPPRTDAPPPAATPAAPVQQQAAPQPKPKMIYLGAFDAGQPGVGIYKVFDPSDRIVCYILMPEVAGRRVVGQALIYDGNTIGSLSCVSLDIKTKQSEDAEAKNTKQKK